MKNKKRIAELLRAISGKQNELINRLNFRDEDMKRLTNENKLLTAELVGVKESRENMREQYEKIITAEELMRNNYYSLKDAHDLHVGGINALRNFILSKNKKTKAEIENYVKAFVGQKK